MKLVIISGSSRENSQSLRVAQFLQSRVRTLSKLEPEIIDLHETPISVNPDDNYLGKKEPNFKKISDTIESCDALILISPEWAGSASPMLRALLVFIGKAASYKPALLVGVSSGRGGAYPIHELKAGGNKNNFITFLPEHLIFRNVEGMLKSDIPASEEEKYIRERSDYAIGILEAFAKALKEVRSSGAVNLEKYPYGM